MLSIFKRKLMGDSFSRGSFSRDELSRKTNNPINELQMLFGHTDIVRLLIKIDDLKIASASDDHLIIIWNRRTGKKCMVLEGHTLPVTCMLVIGKNLLVSGSADKTIRIWDLKYGTCVKELKAHGGSVKCLVQLDQETFCSGSNDRQICVWKNNGELLRTIERQEEENLHCILPISLNRLITASNSHLLLVYKYDTCTYHKVLAYHRESVTCLVRISDTYFASASIDGAIVVWLADTLTPHKILHNPERYRNDVKVYIYNVKYLLPLGEKYLAATIGHGFRVYDIVKGTCVMDCKETHEAEVNCLISLYDGTRIASCSADACIKVWENSQKMSFYTKKKRVPEKSDENKKSSVKLNPILFGEMWGHTDAINQMLKLTETSFASCSSDNIVILWKDGKVESQYRNRFATSIMKHQHSEYSTEDSFSTPIDSFYSVQSTIEESEQEEKESEPTRIPQYIIDNAEMLRKEKKLTVEEVSEVLRKK